MSTTETSGASRFLGSGDVRLLDDLAHGHVPNLFKEMGFRAELKHRPVRGAVRRHRHAAPARSSVLRDGSAQPAGRARSRVPARPPVLWKSR